MLVALPFMRSSIAEQLCWRGESHKFSEMLVPGTLGAPAAFTAAAYTAGAAAAPPTTVTVSVYLILKERGITVLSDGGVILLKIMFVSE